MNSSMEANSTAHLPAQKKDPPEKKRIKLDRSSLGLNLSKPHAVSNGVRTEMKTVKHKNPQGESNTVKSPPNPQERASFKRPAGDDDADEIPLIARSKHRSSSENLKSPGKDSLNNVKKITKIKHESNLNRSPKHEKPTKSEGIDGFKKKKVDSPKVEGVKKLKSEGSPISKPDGVKKIKSEAGLTSPSKSSDVKKFENSSKTSDSKKSKDVLLSPKTDSIKKEKGISLSKLPKVEELKKGKIIDGVDKIKRESSSPEKKVKNRDVGEGVKKVKRENGEEDRSSKEKITTDDSDDDVPLAARAKVKTETGKKSSSKERKRKGSDDDDGDYKPLKKLKKKSEVSSKDTKKEENKGKEKTKKVKANEKTEKGPEVKKEKEKKEEEVWKWWEEEKLPEGIKWLTLEHKGPYFPPAYEPLPDNVNFYYDGKKVKLSIESEEVAGFYAKMLDHDYTSKKIFNDNFFHDWRKEMTEDERALIKNLSKCDFKEIHAYYVQKNEERKNMSKEEKLVIKEQNEAILQEYGYCLMDGHRERVGNFKIEPPGLFRGRGDHPKQGKFKKRLKAKDIIINIGKDAKVPEPPEGQKWKSIQHDNKVTWLACWIENIQGSYKYVMLNPTSRIKGEKDWQKYETARKLKKCIHKIREDYTNDWKSKEMRIRQRGVALYFIDKLALRAGHEKDEDTADTVGCCSLRYEHIKLHKQLEDKEYVVEFDFLGKDSIHYHNLVPVEKRVFKNLELFKQGKSDGDDLFDRLSTTSLNKYLSELMEGLSAKVFRTYNASMTLQDQLNKLEVEDNVAANILGYNRANRAVAILCNHQRSVPKTFEQSMSNLQQKIDDKKKTIKDAKNELKDLKHEAKGSDSVTLTRKIEKKKAAIDRLKEQLFKLEVSQTDKNENKEIALGTSKLNYLDPRISIAWCLKNNVPIEKIYNKTQRQKFAWAIDMTEEDFVF